MLKERKGKKKTVAQQQYTTPPTERTTDKNVIPGLFSDTVSSRDSRQSSWESIYKLFVDEGSTFTQRAITVDNSTLVLSTTYNYVENSFLHRIATRPNTLPYTDMVWWVVDNLSTANKIIFTSKKTIIESFFNE